MGNVEGFATLYQTTVASAIASTDTSLNLTTTAGLPAAPTQFRLRFEPAGGSTSTFEIVLAKVQDATHVQSLDPTTGSVSVNGRGLEGTTAQAWVLNSLATQVITAGGLTNTGPSGTYTALQAAGLTGATAASRYAGAVAAGPPTTGTFAVGDYVVDQRGLIWVCWTAGTPGSWHSIGNGQFRARMTRVAAYTLTSPIALVAFDTTVYDPNSNVSGGQYSAPLTGFYQVNGGVGCGIGVSTDMYCSIFVGGAESARGSRAGSTGTFVLQSHASDIVRITAANTTIDLRAYSSPNANSDGAAVSNYLSVQYIGSG